MASRDIPLKIQQRLDKRKEKSIQRFNNYQEPKQTFLIICEGQNTEPDYFNGFKLGSAQVEAVGTGFNTVSLVNKAIDIKKKYSNKGRKFDQHWVVFDKDDFSAEDFNNAILIAVANGFKVAYSNQCFEYWFLLHFSAHEGHINRKRFEQLLNQHLGFAYSKDAGISSQMFNALLNTQETAIANADRIYHSFEKPHNPAIEESSTTVFQLVNELNKYL
ncbi:RloB-like protein [Chitinophaga sp. CF118]|uniref:RloB family protein n=1 Tax=Chitinophaga sp. CF118 TaxID=1884367 RepID=UPI0008E16EE3|nr:RloB family protein [Chitinophaga sp. CF118]SFD79486.1 RloB-like protein [Chitinophaga sp. CF118]